MTSGASPSDSRHLGRPRNIVPGVGRREIRRGYLGSSFLQDVEASSLETSIVVEGRGGHAAGHELDAFLQEVGVELEPVSFEQVLSARRAWRRFGKGKHQADLNFGDCFAYALAETKREPLLFKGDDFTLTDIEVA